MTKPNKVTVLGAGVWGSVLANHIASNGHNVALWEHFESLLNEIKKQYHHPHIPNFRLNGAIKLTASLEEALDGTELIIVAVSSKSLRELAQNISAILKGREVAVVVATKGVEERSLLTMSEVLENVIPSLKDRVMAFSGPSFALEVARGVPTKIVLAGHSPELLKRTAAVIDAPPIKVERSTDRRGVEWAGAVKNVLAIGCGILDGMGAGTNTKAILFAHGIEEMSRIIIAVDGHMLTAMGPAGTGDFIATGTAEISRNRRMGEKLGKGKTVLQARSEISTVTEGADSVESVFLLTEQKEVDAPIVKTLRKIVREGAKPDTLLKALGF